MRRRKLLVALAGVVALLAAGAFLLWPQPPVQPGVNQASLSKIRPGMNLAEVEVILGGPPFVYPGNGETDDFFDHWRWLIRAERAGLCPPSMAVPEFVMAQWRKAEATIIVFFDPRTEKVVMWQPCGQIRFAKEPGLFDTIIDWWGRQWRKWFPE